MIDLDSGISAKRICVNQVLLLQALHVSRPDLAYCEMSSFQADSSTGESPARCPSRDCSFPNPNRVSPMQELSRIYGLEEVRGSESVQCNS